MNFRGGEWGTTREGSTLAWLGLLLLLRHGCGLASQRKERNATDASQTIALGRVELGEVRLNYVVESFSKAGETSLAK